MVKPVLITLRRTHGTLETMGLVNGQDYHKDYAKARSVAWTAEGLKVTRLRLLSDPGYPFWDVSYCHGEIGKELVRVDLPFNQLPKRGLMGVIVRCAKRDGVHAKDMGLLDAISMLN